MTQQSVAITAGSGTPIAIDAANGVDYQQVKLQWGPYGTVNDVSAANPMPVAQTGAIATVTTVGAVTAITNPLPAGTNTIGGVTLAAGSNAIGTVIATSAATGGATPYHLISAATTNATNVKSSAGTVYSIQVFNFNTTAQRFVKFFDKASTPVPGTDTPVKVLAIPEASGANTPSGVILTNEAMGTLFANGIGFAILSNLADNDATAVGANDVLLNFDWK